MTCFLLHVILNAVKNPTEKVRDIYAVLYSKGLPRSLRFLAMTARKGIAAVADAQYDRLFYSTLY